MVIKKRKWKLQKSEKYKKKNGVVIFSKSKLFGKKQKNKQAKKPGINEVKPNAQML